MANAAIDRGDRQYASTILDGAVKDLHAVGGEAGRLVVGPGGEHLLVARGQILYCNPERTISASNVPQIAIVGRQVG